ncbi:MAG: PAS-domain containing protein [Rhodospirillales bacterium]
MKNKETGSADNDILREGVRHLSQAFSVFDRDLNLVIWNPQFAKLLRFPDELLYEGAPLASFFRYNAERGEYGEGELEALVEERLRLARQNQSHRFQRVTQDGLVLDVVGNPLPSGGFVTTYTDITDRVNLEKELSRAKADHELASRISHTGFWRVQLEPQVLFWSPEIYRIYDLPADQAVTLEQAILGYHPDDRPIVKKLVAEAIEAAKPFECELRIVRPGGETRYCNARGFCETDATGKVIAIFGTFQDVTARVVAEQAHQESDRRYRRLYETSPVMLWTCGKDYLLEAINDRFADKLGYTKDELLNTNVLDLATESTRKLVQGTLRPRLLRDGLYENQLAGFVHRNGSVVEVEMTAYLESEPGRDGFRVLASAVDVSSRFEAERRLRRALDEAELANRTKSQFLANISHELRTPLNSIIGFSQFMSQELLGPLGNPQYLEYSQDILYSGEHLLNLINDILDITKIEAGETQIDEERVVVADVIESCLRMVRQRARAKGLSLRIDGGALKAPVIRADERLFKQILLNLLTNAIKFTSEGEVTVRAGVEQNCPFIEVTDTGVGIAEADQEAVQLPFVQIADAMTRNHEGSGLGLPLTKSLAELHGGKLVLKSVVGEGTTVRVSLPAHRLLSTTVSTAG